MSSNQPSQESRNEARAEEAAAIRRRWLTLGEGLAVTAVLISAMTLWLNWSERSDSQHEKVSASTQAAARAATLTLGAQPVAKGSRLDLKPASSDQQVLGQKIAFPAQFAIDAVETTGDPRIESGWFEDELKRTRNKAGLPDDSRGDERVPLIITTRFLADGAQHEDIALYDVGYTIKGRMFSGHLLELRGLSLVKRVKAGRESAELAARSARLLPRPAR